MTDGFHGFQSGRRIEI